jgi:hypothetical protein
MLEEAALGETDGLGQVAKAGAHQSPHSHLPGRLVEDAGAGRVAFAQEPSLPA